MTTTTDPAGRAAGKQSWRALMQDQRNKNAAALADIRELCVRVQLAAPPYPGHWYDTRPWLDPREHSPLVVDMAAMTLQWAADVGLVLTHPLHPHLVCVPVQPPAQAQTPAHE